MIRVQQSIIAAGLWACFAHSAAHAACEPSFGAMMLDWVETEARDQSRELAEMDYRNRVFNYHLIGHERVQERLEQISRDLIDATAMIRSQEVGLDDNSLATLLRREQAAQAAFGILLSIRQSLDFSKLTLSALGQEFSPVMLQEDGLGHVGRSTLIADLLALSEAANESLNARFGFFIVVRMDEEGNVVGGEGDMGDIDSNGALSEDQKDAKEVSTALLSIAISTGNPYLAIPYIVMGWVEGYEEKECRRRIRGQIRFLLEALDLLPDKLITRPEQAVMFARVHAESLRAFEPVHAEMEALTHDLKAEWAALFGYNLLRRKQTARQLTAAVVARIGDLYGTDATVTSIVNNVRLSEVAGSIADLYAFLARREAVLLASCFDVDGLSALEDFEDGAMLMRETLETYQSYASLAPIGDVIDFSLQRVEDSRENRLFQLDGLRARPCKALTEPTFTFPPAHRAPRLPYNQVPGHSIPVQTGGPERLIRVQAGGGGACITYQAGDLFLCRGDDAGGTYYGDQFSDGSGNPTVDILRSSNDGGYRGRIRAVAQEVEQMISGVEARIETLRKSADAGQAFLPRWTGQNSSTISAARVQAAGRTAAIIQDRQEFIGKTGDGVALSEDILTRLQTTGVDSALTSAIVEQAGGGDVLLSNIPASAYLPNAPNPVGVEVNKEFVAQPGDPRANAILREAAKVRMALPLLSPARSVALSTLETADRFAKGGAVEIADLLLNDARSLRYFESGLISEFSIHVLDPISGNILRRELSAASDLPETSILAIAETFERNRSAQAALSSSLRPVLSSTGQSRRLEALDHADEVRAIAQAEFYSGNLHDGRALMDLSGSLLDLATALTPGISLARDFYEAVSGTDMITGEELSEIARTMAVLGVMTAGIASKGKLFLKVIDKLNEAGVAGRRAEKIFDRALEIDSVRLPWEDSKSLHAELRQSAEGGFDHLGKWIDGRNIDEGLIDEALNQGDRFYDSVNESLLFLQSGVPTGARRAGVTVDVDNDVISTVLWETKTNAEILSEKTDDGLRWFVEIPREP
ncbi:hypothetical protein OCGS_0879 [Oceaniovalibus guishaninsula JLT2003]|uniref:Pre-toxin TG domain-containing protein n=2 Tax=Oceaniovalibus TaxID=1207070 RepID=K2HR23_9RHOB|nr:hypothetical protein OCGS_0879 [Oceaniovalibus guishaninsula JLT2003]